MNKGFRFCSHDQPFLLPPSLQDWLPENHLARFIADVMNELDLSSIYASYEPVAIADKQPVMDCTRLRASSCRKATVRKADWSFPRQFTPWVLI